MDEDLWRRKLARERKARHEAETLLESKALELWASNEKLRALASELEGRVEARTTALRKARDQAVDAERRAEESSQAKSRFLTSISHEIRTPLNAILGYARLLSETTSGVEESNWVHHLVRNADHMTTLLGDVLDLSRIEAGQLEVEQHPVSLLHLLEETLALTRPRSIQRGLKLSLHLQHPLPSSFTSDAIRLQQILLNLLGNALKFTRQGNITLQVSTQRDPLRLLLEVIDTGIGIGQMQLKEIWQPFTQGHDNKEQWFGGTGLGLDISQRLATRLGAQMGVSSTKGTGSTFWIAIPLTQEDLSQLLSTSIDPRLSPEATPPRLDGIRVLVVDDSPDNRLLMELLLQRAGGLVTTCENGQQAVQKVMANPDSVDIVLMDLQMPVMDGLEATQVLRSAGVSLPIIAVSADATPQTRKRIRDVGFTDRLTKPIPPALLLNHVSAYTQQSRSPAPSERLDLGLPEELISAFLDELSGRQLKLRAAVQSQSNKQIRQIVHQIAGSAGSYGYQGLSERAQDVLRSTEYSPTPASLTALLTDIQVVVDEHLQSKP